MCIVRSQNREAQSINRDYHAPIFQLSLCLKLQGQVGISKQILRLNSTKIAKGNAILRYSCLWLSHPGFNSHVAKYHPLPRLVQLSA